MARPRLPTGGAVGTDPYPQEQGLTVRTRSWTNSGKIEGVGLGANLVRDLPAPRTNKGLSLE